MYNPNSINALFTLDKCFHNALKNGHVFRTAELEAVVKVLSCKTHKLGAKAYGCTNFNARMRKECVIPARVNCAPHVAKRPQSVG